ncbi:carboxypeptidase Q [Massilia sp. MP_M2]|uniref:M20/M25/M40 family metallo-hydrolase n=1 Tax=Massilia sp. MP_M2 TaxID=3071713 RepID=UPI00319E177C
MNFPVRHLRRLSILVAIAAVVNSAPALATSPGNDPAALVKIREAAMTSDYAWQRTEDMTDLIGPRLSGSPGAAAAVTQVAEAMRKLGAKVTLQPVKVPHWVRGIETGELVDYTGRPAGITQRIVLTALGGSGATPVEGLVAPVLVLNSFEELKTRSAEVKGKIVLFDVAFDQHMADRGLAGQAYGAGSNYRRNGPRMAAELGALGALVRSVGGAAYRLPHTGSSGLSDDARIPAAAVTAEDAMLMARLAKRGPVKLKLVLTPKNLPDADSFNVIADLPGVEKPEEIVIVSGHLDSWDLSPGAHDDAAAVASAMAVFDILKKLDFQPRRTIRFIAWMNEENGMRGASTYLAAEQANAANHFGAIESDNGVGRPFGLRASVTPQSVKLFAPLQAALQPIGAGVFQRQDVLATGDLAGLERAGVPSFAPIVDTARYFDIHHTPADTLDKVDPDSLRRNVALMAATAWYLANMAQPIGRSSVPER